LQMFWTSQQATSISHNKKEPSTIVLQECFDTSSPIDKILELLKESQNVFLDNS